MLATTINIGSHLWVLLVGLGIPVLVEALTKSASSSRMKGLLAIVTSAIVAFVNLLTTNKGVISADFVTPFIMLYGAQILSYLGFWKPVVGLPGSIAPNVGLGDPEPTLDNGEPWPED